MLAPRTKFRIDTVATIELAADPAWPKLSTTEVKALFLSASGDC